MSYLNGEFECKLDNKGRMMIPAGLKKQLPEAEKESFVVNRGFKKYLVIYTKSEWDKKLDELNKLNQYETKNIEFIRYFTRGATELTLDAAGRVNLPQGLLDYAGISGDVVLNCMLTKIEMWDRAAYNAMIESEPENFAALAEEVMGDKRREGGL
ncbi:MAG: division/cell wall cluster transcriptional repressor MraZ [Mucilaginibacter sp.]|uniref:division/cell wall cluster transcriptional repressor MraZ n=1 Tax=Mucilaginibacter sp. L3T2-6 TaxID=3062491 RepID=UPI0026771F78|nr:division/cell wall cluster transcriptional repressor MraZ [Mucilaginibacter sp. L3T2-6]MDO3645288.1 division/cell wall cluster transcriptional repressor MraZ [Mucilaginibacter sp. L3T2-6]MDV6217740.1 division/cell wall cluster transcriptional repressor MraZ [Mucilaginibacter sp. L3T2-6]